MPAHELDVEAGMQTGSKGGTTKSLTNDPNRQGNIWHRYEQLENATNTLFSVNQQLVEERTRHKQVLSSPPTFPFARLPQHPNPNIQPLEQVPFWATSNKSVYSLIIGS